MKRIFAFLLVVLMLGLVGCEVDADLDVRLDDGAQTTVVIAE